MVGFCQLFRCHAGFARPVRFNLVSNSFRITFEMVSNRFRLFPGSRIGSDRFRISFDLVLLQQLLVSCGFGSWRGDEVVSQRFRIGFELVSSRLWGDELFRIGFELVSNWFRFVSEATNWFRIGFVSFVLSLSASM